MTEQRLPRTVTYRGRAFVIQKAAKLAVNLGSNDTLADGTIVLKTSHQFGWFYVQGVRPDGRIVRRRYRHQQMVFVEDWQPA